MTKQAKPSFIALEKTVSKIRNGHPEVTRHTLLAESEEQAEALCRDPRIKRVARSHVETAEVADHSGEYTPAASTSARSQKAAEK